MGQQLDTATPKLVFVGGLLSAVLFYGLYEYQPYASPENAIASTWQAAAREGVNGLKSATTQGYYEDLVGQFGERKYEEVRRVYQRAYDLAGNAWLVYRNKAEYAARNEYFRLIERVQSQGREAIMALPLDERLRLMDDREQYNIAIFERGLAALTPEERLGVTDAQALREQRNFGEFVERNAWRLLSPEDQASLGAPGTIAAGMNPDKMRFLERVGIPQLGERDRAIAAEIPSSALADSRSFMLQHGEVLARQLFAGNKIPEIGQGGDCRFPEQEQSGSLFRGSRARCPLTAGGITFQGSLVRSGFGWKLDRLTPDIPALFPEEADRQLEQASTSGSFTRSRPSSGAPPPERVVASVNFPRARWVQRPAEGEGSLLMLIGSTVRGWLYRPMMWLAGVGLFIVIMSINYRRLKNEKFVPEWLDNETQLDEVSIPLALSRVTTRLTNRRVLQVQLKWFLSHRKVYAIALDDVHSVVWKRSNNWMILILSVIALSIYTPFALLLLMLGLEAKVHSIRFGTPFAQMPWTRITVTSFSRKHFNELSRFFRKAQLYWAQVRTQKQLPVPSGTTYAPEYDKDFAWGPFVWAYVLLWFALAVALRLSGRSVDFAEPFVPGMLLGTIVGAAALSQRNALWTAFLGFAIFLTVKFPDVGFLYLLMGMTAPIYYEEYATVLVALLVGAWVSAFLAERLPRLTYLSPLLWFGLLAIVKTNSAMDWSFFGNTAVAIATAGAVAWMQVVYSRRVSNVKLAHGATA